MDAPTAVEPAVEHTEDELDEEFAPHRRQRLGKATVLLAVLVIAGGGFLAGAYTQKTQTPAPSAGANRLSLAGGTGGTGGGGGAAGAGRTGRGGAASASAAPSSAEAAPDAGPAVIGQVVKVTGNTVVVENLGGKQVTVALSPDTAVSKAATIGDLAPGQTVTVGGTTGPDGNVAATTVLSK